MKELILANAPTKISRGFIAVGLLVSLLFIIVGMYAVTLIGGGSVICFVDVPSLLLVTGVSMALVILSGYLGDLVRAVQILFRKRAYTRIQLEKGIAAVKLLITLNIAVGMLVTVGQAILAMSRVDNADMVFRSIPVLLLAFLYSLLLDLIWIPCCFRLISYRLEKF
jgi:hypothetical protein